MKLDHTVKKALESKLKEGATLTADDIEQARNYAKALGTNHSRALYAQVKRSANVDTETNE